MTEKPELVLSRLTGLADMLPPGRCCLGLHLELKLDRKVAPDVCSKKGETEREHANLQPPYLCPGTDFSPGRMAAWSSLNGFTTVIVTERGHDWYQRWMWTDNPIHSTHQPVAFRMSHLAAEQKYRQKCYERLLSATQSKVKTLNHRQCVFWANLNAFVQLWTCA